MNNLFIGNGSGHNEVYLWECVFARVSLEDVLRTKRSTGCWVAGLRSGSAVVGCDRIATIDVGQGEPRVVCRGGLEQSSRVRNYKSFRFSLLF